MIEIVSPGLQTTIQDLGRLGFMHYGISHSGAMDDLSCKIANRLVGMADNNPVLECTQVGPSIKFNSAMSIAICGAEMEFTVNGRPVNNQEAVSVMAGDLLEFKTIHSGFRCYIAFNQRMSIEAALDSVSTHVTAGIGGLQGRSLKAGDRIEFIDVDEQAISDSKPPIYYSGNYQIRFTESPESGLFNEEQRRQFQSSDFSVTKDLSRMGIRLNSEQALKISNYPQMQSRGLLPGAIQIPPDGSPIIAGKDAQTTGGYARIGQIIAADMPLVGQLKPNDEVQFQRISIEQALAIKKQQDHLLSK